MNMMLKLESIVTILSTLYLSLINNDRSPRVAGYF